MKVWIVKRESFYGETKVIKTFASLYEAKKFLGKIKRDCIMSGRKTKNLRNQGKYIGFNVYSDNVNYYDYVRNCYFIYVEVGVEVQ